MFHLTTHPQNLLGYPLSQTSQSHPVSVHVSKYLQYPGNGQYDNVLFKCRTIKSFMLSSKNLSSINMHFLMRRLYEAFSFSSFSTSSDNFSGIKPSPTRILTNLVFILFGHNNQKLLICLY